MNNLNKLLTEEYFQDLLVRMAHNSTAIEGNTLTQAETISILLHKVIPKTMNEREYYEVKNYEKTFNYIFNNKDEFSIEKIKKFHYLIMDNIRDDNGKFKKSNNSIIGATFETTPAYQIPYVLKEWLDNYNYRIKIAKTNTEKLEIILKSHIDFERIHPFSDGNGRTGRIIMIEQCIQENLDFFVIPVNDKWKYINFLQNENGKDFAKWCIELQKIENERIKNFYNNFKENHDR
ncbi:Fic family protein [Oceanivirga miroungae]|uniref:Filamentation induced by cAMP protein fic n=1 Tax=Oceanivirga miroungae TaxID=1130046 RepID=A0A6I8M7W9_9FUSO|nr:Fic family protein [Oceanivirga miroungae]VWL84931.1 filamentation induced by cAMP protein fic [Oceanivirga miroungae]